MSLVLMIIVHDPKCAEYGSSMRPEQPARITRTAAHLRVTHPDWQWRLPTAAADDTLLLAHTPAHRKRLKQPHDFDADTPYFKGIDDHARRAVGAAVLATELATTNRSPVFSLMRPPGHHATADQAMGFCYLNAVAIAVLAAQRSLSLDAGPGAKVAVWDFDAHHGNGTEAILLGRPDMLFASVHQSPGYPGTGRQSQGNCLNWPVPPRFPRQQHMAALEASWAAVTDFRPELIVVSAGFDAYARDPITDMTLELEDFRTLGTWLAHAEAPVAAVLEGGYSDDLPLLIDAFLSAWKK
jgi:acetoin utilization deacetylase AcuC-like enzyme